VVAAAAAPLVLGALVSSLGRGAAMTAALVGPLVHFVLYGLGTRPGVRDAAAGLGLDLGNPGVTAAVAILASTATALTIHGSTVRWLRTSSSGARPAYPARRPASLS
jgi:hypothetical protein